MAKRGRPKNPNSQRSLLEKKKEAEQLALEAEAKAEQLAAELAEKERLLAEKEAKLAEAQERAEREAAEQEARRQQEEAEKEAKLDEEWKKLQERLEAESKETDPIEEIQVEEEDKEFADADSLLSMLNDNLTKEKHPEQANNEAELNNIINDDDGDFSDDFDEQEAIPEIIKETPEGLEYRIPASETADMIVTGVDVFLRYIGPYTYKKAMFSKDEIKRMTVLRQQAKLKPKSEMVYEDSDYEIVDKLDAFLEYQNETVPLSPDEIKMLKAPLKVIFKDKGGQISPTAGLIYAATMIALPRFAPQGGEMLQKLFTKFLNYDETESETES